MKMWDYNVSAFSRGFTFSPKWYSELTKGGKPYENKMSDEAKKKYPKMADVIGDNTIGSDIYLSDTMALFHAGNQSKVETVFILKSEN